MFTAIIAAICLAIGFYFGKIVGEADFSED
jgi:hypothetical protein